MCWRCSIRVELDECGSSLTALGPTQVIWWRWLQVKEAQHREQVKQHSESFNPESTVGMEVTVPPILLDFHFSGFPAETNRRLKPLSSHRQGGKLRSRSMESSGNMFQRAPSAEMRRGSYARTGGSFSASLSQRSLPHNACAFLTRPARGGDQREIRRRRRTPSRTQHPACVGGDLSTRRVVTVATTASSGDPDPTHGTFPPSAASCAPPGKHPMWALGGKVPEVGRGRGRRYWQWWRR